MAVLYTNNAASNLSASITNTATSFSVTSGQGALFPSLSNGNYFYVTLIDGSNNIEIVKVTARSVDTFTVTRAQDGTAARAWSANDKVELRITRAMLDDIKADATAGYLPLSGGTVTGTTRIGNLSIGYGTYLNSIRPTGDTNLNLDTPSGATYATNLYIGSNQVLHAGNYTDYAAAAGHTHSYLPLSGGTLTGKVYAGSSDGDSIEVRNDTASAASSGYITFKNKNGSGVYRPAARISGVNVDNAYDGDFLVETYSGGVAYKGLRVDENSNVLFYDTSGNVKFQWDAVNSRALINSNVVLHAGNYGSYALPLSGGTLTGSRPITFNTGNGWMYVQGNSGGWAMGHGFYGSSGTFRGGFGAYGGGDDLTYFFVGADYNNTSMTWSYSGITANKVTTFAGSTTDDPISAIHVVGNGYHTGVYINPTAGYQAHLRFGTGGTLKWQIRAPFQDSANTALKYYSWVAGADVFSFSHAGQFDAIGAITQNGNQVLHAGNYTSYSPSLTGSGASGTWGININGAAYALRVTDSRSSSTTPQSIDMGVLFEFKENGAGGLSDGGGYFGHMTFRQYGSGTDWSGGASHQLGFTDNGNVWQRSGTGTSWGSWKKLLDSSNYTDYAAAASHTHTSIVSPNGASVVSADAAFPSAGQTFQHSLALGPGGNDGHILAMSWANTASIYGAQIWLDTDPTNRMAIRSRNSGGTWNGWSEVLTDSNYTNYTGQYVQKSGDTMTGNLKLSGAALVNNSWGNSSANAATRLAPKGAAGSWDGSPVGAIKIRLPIRANDTMWRMTVKIYNYSDNTISEYHIGNYSYSTGAYNAAASFIGSGNASPRNVRLGNDGSYDCVWIGDTDTTWVYPVVAVTDFTGGFRNADNSAWGNSWDVSIVTSFGTIGATINPYVNLSISSKVAGSEILHAGNYFNYTLPMGGGWYGSGLPGSRWGGYSVNGGEISFGRDLPNNGQMGILVDGCYVAGENNGFWSMGSDNTWGSRRGMYWDGSYLNLTTNTPTTRVSSLRSDGTGSFASYLTVGAGHGDTRFQMRIEYPNNPGTSYNGYLTAWVSEPGISWSFCGIGGNVNIGGQYYGRQVDTMNYATYIRWDTNAGQTQFWNSSGIPGSAGGQGSCVAYVNNDGNIYATTSQHTVLHAGNYSSYALPLTGGTVSGNLGLGVAPDIRLSVNGEAHISSYLYMGGTAGSYNSWGSRDYTTSGNRYINANYFEVNNYGYGSSWSFAVDNTSARYKGYALLHASNYQNYLGDWSYGNYRFIADYGSNNTWNIRGNGYFIWGRAHDWTQSFSLNLGNGTSGSNDGWAQFGQSNSNNTNGTWFGTRFVQFSGGSAIDGYVRAGRYYVGGDSYYMGLGDWGWRHNTPYGWIQFGPANGSWAHIYANLPFYFNQDLYVNNSKVLNAGNFTDYTPVRVAGSAGYPHAGYGMLPFYNWGGSNGGAGAPSDSTYTIGIAVGSHPSDQAYGFQIARNMWNTGLWTRGYDSGWGGWVRLLDSSNYTDYVPISTSGGASKVLKTDTNAYLYLNSWMQVNGGGLFSSTNSAHWYPADGSYGAWKMSGSRNGWSGVAFGSLNNGEVTLMVNPSSNETGFYNPSYGWQFRWMSGTLWVCKNTYGGGTEATVLDSSNYSSYAMPLSGSVTTNAYITFNQGFTLASGAMPYFGNADFTVAGGASLTYFNSTTPSANTTSSVCVKTYSGRTPNFLTQTVARRIPKWFATTGGTFGSTSGILVDEIYVGNAVNAYTQLQQDTWSFYSSYAGSMARHFIAGGASIGPGSSTYDNWFSAGTSSARYTVVYAVTGSINTSDINEKEQIQDLDAAELRVATAIKGLIKRFKWKDAVVKKGADARIHVGVIAQEVEQAFVTEGLDPSKYALFCKDVWWEFVGENGLVETSDKEVEGGVRKERKGIRYDQLLAFVIAAI